MFQVINRKPCTYNESDCCTCYLLLKAELEKLNKTSDDINFLEREADVSCTTYSFRLKALVFLTFCCYYSSLQLSKTSWMYLDLSVELLPLTALDLT